MELELANSSSSSPDKWNVVTGRGGGKQQAVQQFSDQRWQIWLILLSTPCKKLPFSITWISVWKCRETLVFAWQRACVGQEYNWQVCDTCCLLWGRKQSITAQFTVHNSPSCHQPTVGSLTPSLDCIVKVSPSTEQLTAARCCLAGGEGWMSSWWQTGGWIPGKYGHNRHSAFNALIILLHLHNIKEINKLYESLFIIVYFAQSKQTKH